MTCREYRSELMEAARGEARSRAAKDHAEECASCSQFFEEQLALTVAYAGIEEESPPELEASLLAEFDSVRRRRRFAGFATACALLAAGLAAFMLLPKNPAAIPVAPPAVVSRVETAVVVPAPIPVKPAARPRKTTKRRSANLPETPFLQIPYTLPLAPYERASVVRMELPVAALISAGLPIQTANPGAQAQADVMMGEDGRVRAVRLISVSGN